METETTEITVQEEVQEEEKEPIFFSHKRVSLISDFASILSWVVLVGFIGNFVLQVMGLQTQIKTNSYVLAELFKEPSFFLYLFSNLLVPLLTGHVFFGVLQAAAMGLNILLENDINAREGKSKGKA